MHPHAALGVALCTQSWSLAVDITAQVAARRKVAFDAPGALDLAARDVPDVALLDLGLPVIDGYELATIRQLPGSPDMID